MDKVIGGLIAVAIYLVLIYLFFLFVYPIAALAGAAVVSGWAIVNCCRAVAACCRGQLPASVSDGPTGSEPAYRQYFFRRAFLDIRDIVTRNWEHNRRTCLMLVAGAKRALVGEGENHALLIFTWPLGVVFVTVGMVGVAAALGVNIAVVLAFSSVIVLAVIVNCLLTLGVRSLEQTILWVRHFANHCPRPGCYDRFYLPVYECKACGARHKSLVPGTYGVFRRKCKCGKRLPTTYLFGRHRLESFCPNPRCGCRLGDEDPTARPVLLPLIAGRSAGKTTFQVGLLLRLKERERRHQCKLSFVLEEDRLEYEGAVAMFQRGQVLAQTLARVPKALQLNYSTARGKKLRIHLYDPAGEAVMSEQDLAQLTYIRQCHGIIMLIDPFSVGAIRERFEREIAAHPRDVSPSDADVGDVYEGLLDFLREHRVPSRRGRVKIPLLVIVTKRDAFGLVEEIGEPAVRKAQRRENQLAKDEGRAPRKIELSEVVRQWLLDQNLRYVINNIEGQFAQCRYFSCSVFGEMPSKLKGRPFVPDEVEAPFDWILGVHRITKPKSA